MFHNRAALCYCKVGQELLQSVGQLIQYRVRQSLLQSGATSLPSGANITK